MLECIVTVPGLAVDAPFVEHLSTLPQSPAYSLVSYSHESAIFAYRVLYAVETVVEYFTDSYSMGNLREV